MKGIFKIPKNYPSERIRELMNAIQKYDSSKSYCFIDKEIEFVDLRTKRAGKRFRRK